MQCNFTGVMAAWPSRKMGGPMAPTVLVVLPTKTRATVESKIIKAKYWFVKQDVDLGIGLNMP